MDSDFQPEKRSHVIAKINVSIHTPAWGTTNTECMTAEKIWCNGFLGQGFFGVKRNQDIMDLKQF
jgi:hypothetical protein